MLIHSLDLGQRSGFAIGPAGKVPNSGFLILRKKGQSIAHAGFNLEEYLSLVWGKARPDLVVYERPLTINAWFDQCKRKGRPQNGEGLEHVIKLAHDVEKFAYRAGIQCESIARTSIMWKITGQQGFGDYEANKRAVLTSLIRQEMLPIDCKDNDRADAVAMHVVASGKFARCQNTNFGLFAGNPA